MTEDDIKRLLHSWLRKSGWTNIDVKWGNARGADIMAKNGDQRWVIEVKGTPSRAPMFNNFFLAALGEILQRMDDPETAYSLAFPDLMKFRRLWSELPAIVKQRLKLSALFVSNAGKVEVEG